MKSRKEKIEDIWKVIHRNMDGFTSTLVRAKTKREALKLYNSWRAGLSKYPYYYSRARLEDVYTVEVLICDK